MGPLFHGRLSSMLSGIRSLLLGLCTPVTLYDLHAVEGSGLGDFHRLSDFIQGIVVHRRDEAIRGSRNWLRRIPWCTPTSGLGQTWFPPAPFLQREPHLSSGGSGNMFGWSQLEKTVRSGVWLFRGALRGENLFSSLCAAGDWVKKRSYHTAWAVPGDSSCTCSYAYGRGPAVGPQIGKRCCPLLAGLWRAIAPLMKPWCAEGDVPTAANLNLYRGRSSHVGWHSDDEPLFGERGEAKLIVSVSFGTQALFKWKG